MAFCQTVKSGLARIARTDAGTGHGRNTRVWRGLGKAESHRPAARAFFLTAQRPARAGNPGRRVRRERRNRTKRQPDFVRGKGQTRRKNGPKARLPAAVQPPENFVAARKKFLSAKKSRFWHTKKGIRGREMPVWRISRPRILTFAVFPTASRPSRARRKRAEKFLFDSGIQDYVTKHHPTSNKIRRTSLRRGGSSSRTIFKTSSGSMDKYSCEMIFRNPIICFHGVVG